MDRVTHKRLEHTTITCETRDHGHALGSRRSDRITDYLGDNPGGSPWNSTGKPLLLLDPNWILIDQLPGSISLLCMPLSEASALIGTPT